MDLAGKRALVMGLGMHGGGVGVARFLARYGARVTVTDLKSEADLRESLDALAGLPIDYVLGEHRASDFAQADLIVRNPGVPREHALLQEARARGVPIEMEIGLFLRACPAPITAVTGTKGKTTTALLVGEIFKAMDPRTVVAGNLRVSALDTLDQIDATTPVVLEMSSWQCEGLADLQTSPHRACITNLHPDHLNRYANMGEYADAKALIFKYQQPGDVVVLNADQKQGREWADQAPARVAWFSRTQPIDGVYLLGDDIVRQAGGQVEVIARRTDLQLPGDHNVENALAAVALALDAGASPAQIQPALRAFHGVPHRMELVRELNGVRWINDSTATAPAAAIAALKAVGENIIWIGGGSDKKLDFEALGRSLSVRAKLMLLLEGEAHYMLDSMIRFGGGGTRILGRYKALADAVQDAFAVAQPGDTVLFSPACASFGMFQNEFDRGDQFRALVMGLGQE
ncbi:MAG: UDP-N-acetylmuramoyl-L-alanine--D-glutamate ligase [Chloroflexi bacterium]|nr:UDP-N-acetylmuramoyl-L-alanine--D-glutamate ligase [Chloroflexota bacterium]